jgi:glyoxylase-like metal-dependent hydrolase (beta-lactamase superfamily II)
MAAGAVESVWSVKYGERVVHKSDVFHDYASYGLPDGNLDMDYNFWVIKAGGSTILMDTGYDIAAHDWLGEISVTPTPEGLRIVGVEPLEVCMVITSHFHYDHIGYLGLFERAQIVAGRREHEYWFAKRDAKALEGEFTTEDDLVPVERAEREGRLRLIDGEEEVHPGITVRQVGGHCPGETIAILETASGPLVLASDAAHFYEQLEYGWPFFAFTDLGEMRQALALIQSLARDGNATVVPGHDGRTRSRFPAAPGSAGAIATVLA